MENKEKVIFWGVELNEEEKKNHRISYATMAKQFDAVLCNSIIDVLNEVDPCYIDNIESGSFSSYYYNGEEMNEEEWKEKKETLEEEYNDLILIDEEELTPTQQKRIEELEKDLELFEEVEDDIFQWFIVDNNALWFLKRNNELVFYSEKLDCYIWGVKHWGTSWDYVMTSLKLNDDFTSLL